MISISILKYFSKCMHTLILKINYMYFCLEALSYSAFRIDDRKQLYKKSIHRKIIMDYQYVLNPIRSLKFCRLLHHKVIHLDFVGDVIPQCTSKFSYMNSLPHTFMAWNENSGYKFEFNRNTKFLIMKHVNISADKHSMFIGIYINLLCSKFYSVIKSMCEASEYKTTILSPKQWVKCFLWFWGYLS